ncbi:MAG: hypothetical protein K2L69_08015, partial [Muribaculaceae bacterium]|nr:hypothetical protein [Muribaculaceae bacterium]
MAWGKGRKYRGGLDRGRLTDVFDAIIRMNQYPPHQAGFGGYGVGDTILWLKQCDIGINHSTDVVAFALSFLSLINLILCISTLVN